MISPNTFKKRACVLISFTLLSGSVLIGCATKKEISTPQATFSEPRTEAVSSHKEKENVDTPGISEEHSVLVTAKVTKIDRKKRIVTLKFPDGHTSEITCGPEVRNFPQIQVGDDVTAEFVESVELFIAGSEGYMPIDETTAIKRAPKGEKPGVTAARSVESTATVIAVDYKTRKVTLKGKEGKVVTVHVSSKVKRLEEVKPGDTVVARYTEAVSIDVSAPEKPTQ